MCVEFEVITSIKIGLSHSCKKETCIYRTFIGHSQKSPEQKYLPESTAGKDYISLTRNGNLKFRLNFQNFKQNEVSEFQPEVAFIKNPRDIPKVKNPEKIPGIKIPSLKNPESRG